MKRKPKNTSSEEVRAEYDPTLIRKGVRGKYAERYRAGTNLVLLAPDVARAFPTEESVNQALRTLIGITKSLRRIPSS